MNDPIDPEHYRRNGIELGDVFEAWQLGYWDGCAAKYIFRARYKGNRLQDLEKARRCLDKEIARLKRDEKQPIAPKPVNAEEAQRWPEVGAKVQRRWLFTFPKSKREFWRDWEPADE